MKKYLLFGESRVADLGGAPKTTTQGPVKKKSKFLRDVEEVLYPRMRKMAEEEAEAAVGKIIAAVKSLLDESKAAHAAAHAAEEEKMLLDKPWLNSLPPLDAAIAEVRAGMVRSYSPENPPPPGKPDPRMDELMDRLKLIEDGNPARGAGAGKSADAERLGALVENLRADLSGRLKALEEKTRGMGPSPEEVEKKRAGLEAMLKSEHLPAQARDSIAAELAKLDGEKGDKTAGGSGAAHAQATTTNTPATPTTPGPTALPPNPGGKKQREDSKPEKNKKPNKPRGKDADFDIPAYMAKLSGRFQKMKPKDDSPFVKEEFIQESMEADGFVLAETMAAFLRGKDIEGATSALVIAICDGFGFSGDVEGGQKVFRPGTE